jgi:hypothetical protein
MEQQPKQKKQPDERINRLMAQLKEANGGMLDESIAKNRQYCYLLLNKLAKDYPDQDAEASVSLLITSAKSHNFHGPNTTSFKYLYYNASKIINVTRGANPTVKREEYGRAAAEAIAARLGKRSQGC